MADAAAPKDAAGSAAPAAAAGAAAARPTKPDEAAYNEQLAKAEKEYNDAMERYNAVKAKIDIAQPNRNKDAPTPTQKRRQELITQANEIRQKQAGGKNARTGKLDQVKRLDEQLRIRVTEQKAARARVPFKSAEDIDREIERLDRQVNGGMMKLVDEKKALAEISSLRKQRKNFAQFDEAQKQIDDLRAKIKEIKDSMDDPEARGLSEQYSKVQAELDAIKAEQDEAFKGLSSLRDERTRLQAEQQDKYQAVRRLRNEYHAQKRAFAEHEREQRQRARERQQAERDRVVRERKRENAQRILDDASDPAYLEEIRRARSLLHFLDPSQPAAGGGPDKAAPLLADSGMTAQAQRKVDDAGIKGTRLVRKEDREDDYLPAAAGKKGKKGRKGAAAGAAGADAPTAKSFNLPPSVLEDCTAMGVDPPMSAAEVAAVVDKVKQKLDHWILDQAAQTQRNIEKAKKEIERLDAEEAAGAGGTASGTATPTTAANGKKDESTENGLAEATKDLKDASLEDNKKQEVAA